MTETIPETTVDERDELIQFVPTAGVALTPSDAKLAEVLVLLRSFSQIDGEHHKAWSLDQVARIVTGERYDDFIKDYMFGEDAPTPEEELLASGDWYEWSEGIAP